MLCPCNHKSCCSYLAFRNFSGEENRKSTDGRNLLGLVGGGASTAVRSACSSSTRRRSYWTRIGEANALIESETGEQ